MMLIPGTRRELPRVSQGIGAPLRRVEDRRLLLGRGLFVADVVAPEALHCVLLRSPHAHARISGIDASAALSTPGVVAVFTGKDMAADDIKPMRPLWIICSRDGSPMAEPPRFTALIRFISLMTFIRETFKRLLRTV